MDLASLVELCTTLTARQSDAAIILGTALTFGTALTSLVVLGTALALTMPSVAARPLVLTLTFDSRIAPSILATDLASLVVLCTALLGTALLEKALTPSTSPVELSSALTLDTALKTSTARILASALTVRSLATSFMNPVHNRYCEELLPALDPWAVAQDPVTFVGTPLAASASPECHCHAV